ncbi:MAG: addiction module protein [Acidobacteria bacterium]|nr:addiction module protein [Acidobacteriota bacterium]
MTRDEIFDAAQTLPPSELRRLALDLSRLAGLPEGGEDVPEDEWKAAWCEEVEQRIAAHDAGLTKAIPVEVALAEARALLARR